MPERDAKLPLWNSDEVQANAAKYIDRYPAEFGYVEDWYYEEAQAMDDIMVTFNAIAGVPTEVWDMFHERWRDVSLLYFHLALPPDDLSEEDARDYMARALIRFFRDDEEFLQMRPNNN